MAIYEQAPEGIYLVMTKDTKTVSPMMPLELAKTAAAIMADKTGEPVLIISLAAVVEPAPTSPYPSYVAN